LETKDPTTAEEFSGTEEEWVAGELPALGGLAFLT
jgi:hypothetical protein